MTKDVGLLVGAFKDFDRVLENVTLKDAIRSTDGESSFAWTLAHVTNQVDAWVNVRFQKISPHPIIGQPEFRYGGTGKTEEWNDIQKGVMEVRKAALLYLRKLDDSDLQKVIPYDGSYTFLKEKGFVSLIYVILRASAHHYYHIGEIATKRTRLGQLVGVYPGGLEECL